MTLPTLDLARADRCAREAFILLRGKLPADYPANATTIYNAAVRDQRKDRASSVVVRVADQAEQLLIDARATEVRAVAVQALAVEALRWCGTHGLPWDRIGELVGMTGQGAHKRWRGQAEAGTQTSLEAEVLGA